MLKVLTSTPNSFKNKAGETVNTNKVAVVDDNGAIGFCFLRDFVEPGTILHPVAYITYDNKIGYRLVPAID